MLVEIAKRNFPFSGIVKFVTVMDPEAAKTARESLDLAFHMSNLLNTGLDRHTLSVLIALCDLGLNPEALAAVVKELRSESVSSSSFVNIIQSSLVNIAHCNIHLYHFLSFYATRLMHLRATKNVLTELQYGFTQQDHWVAEIQVFLCSKVAAFSRNKSRSKAADIEGAEVWLLIVYLLVGSSSFSSPLFQKLF
ncbi:hypothetical protein POTOM_022509 [Populus tomentosa]|uniref:Uncharacterized protein n=1 Tax=Populus tomentosa TaxID=118781 RepID=A0A8X7ZHS4_POPTO|nr:hypothetical protein POTOM_022509 [Populus tomentosa]